MQGYQFEICLRIRGPNVTNPRKYGILTVECLLLKKKKKSGKVQTATLSSKNSTIFLPF